MVKRWLFSIGVVSVGLVAGCGSSGSSKPAVAETQPVKRPIPPDSPFAKIKEGMQTDQVFATIGQPTTQGAYATGKAWIPFHYGGDNARLIARYKGIGTIIFSSNSAFGGGMSVIEINYDPDELGYEPPAK